MRTVRKVSIIAGPLFTVGPTHPALDIVVKRPQGQDFTNCAEYFSPSLILAVDHLPQFCAIVWVTAGSPFCSKVRRPVAHCKPSGPLILNV